MLETLKERFKLPEQELSAIFEKKIVPEYIDPALSCDKPCIVFVTAQQAAGKSTAVKKAKQQFNDRIPVAFCRDNMRKFDPNIVEIRTQYPADQSALTAHNSSRLRDMVLVRASGAESRKNIIYEAVLKKDRYDEVKNAINIAKDQGYPAECHVVAVHEYESGVSMFKRYENEIRDNGLGKVTPHVKNHDQAYNEMPALVKQMQEEGMFERVVVQDRQGNVYYDSTKAEYQGMDVVQGIEKGRQALFDNPDWRRKLESDWDEVMSMMQSRGASTEETKTAQTVRNRLDGKNRISNTTAKRKMLLEPVASPRKRTAILAYAIKERWGACR